MILCWNKGFGDIVCDNKLWKNEIRKRNCVNIIGIVSTEIWIWLHYHFITFFVRVKSCNKSSIMKLLGTGILSSEHHRYSMNIHFGNMICSLDQGRPSKFCYLYIVLLNLQCTDWNKNIFGNIDFFTFLVNYYAVNVYFDQRQNVQILRTTYLSKWSSYVWTMMVYTLG